jgi:hypothetical protein
MSGATHTQIPIRQRLRRDQRRAKTIALAAVTAFTAMLVALLLALDGGNAPTTDDNRPAVQAKDSSIPQSREPGVRFDGGPEEGTVDVSSSQLLVTQNRAFPGLASVANAAQADGRPFDGGPEEGTRGVLSTEAEPSTRYDGGPEEGSRGPGH